MNNITVFGADWCEDTHRTRHRLDLHGVPYDYVDVDRDEAANHLITRQNNGKRKTPTVDLNGKFLIEPTDPELDAALRSAGLIGEAHEQSAS
ncbi:MAG TPA: glutaredoxin domain-containing protein [Tepidisphaeraceae bacterium]|nr:glutaredoxin domain-containing protein [Tepidisphaeraceae bacterium]